MTDITESAAIDMIVLSIGLVLLLLGRERIETALGFVILLGGLVLTIMDIRRHYRVKS